MAPMAWNLRKYCAFYTASLIGWKFGPDTADNWLWNHTCFPFDVPLWSQVWQGIRLLDGSLSWKRLAEQQDAQYRRLLKDYREN